MIILKRLDAGMEDLLRENQCGFRRNRSCIDQIYALRTIIHNCLEFNIPLCINFVDFKAAFDSIIRDFIWTSMRHEERVVLDTDYADDMAIMDNCTAGLHESTDLLAHYSSYAGLKINAKKTKCMAISNYVSQRPYIEDDYIELEVAGEPVEQVSNFIYLGVTKSGDGKIDRDLDVRIQKANGAFHQLWKIWNS